MDPIVWVALIGLPAQIILAVATLKKARSTDRAVNHRVSNRTISEDIADMRKEMRHQRRDIIWLIREFSDHMRGHGHDDD